MTEIKDSMRHRIGEHVDDNVCTNLSVITFRKKDNNVLMPSAYDTSKWGYLPDRTPNGGWLYCLVCGQTVRREDGWGTRYDWE